MRRCSRRFLPNSTLATPSTRKTTPRRIPHIEALDSLRAADITLAVLTNKDHDAALPLVERFFGQRFAVVQGALAAFPPKPAVPITRYVLAPARRRAPQRVLYVGDSNVDVQTGHNAGLLVAGAAWGFRGATELEAAGADFILEHPDELIALAGA